ncbi:MAG: hypothetical protein DA408_06975 [Bacteroidetes bacterium]|nr:MAG: hypothetical protein C7N36_05695 [Bacteroidota bacterium]PTM13448.1 MAG: hypothetical protein DA408_06975 [Bacteroidota bacterium]
MKFSSIFLLQHHLVVLLVLTLTGSGWSQTTENTAAIAAQALLDQAVANHQFAGIAAGFATADTILWAGAAGYRDVQAAEPFLPTTITRMASIAKTLTAVAVLQLYERGLVDLDAPIQTYLPEFPRKPQGEITTRQLLQHRSGIGGYASGKEAESQVDYPTTAAAAAVFQDRDLVSVPGQEYQYSTYGYVVLGMLIERVSGQSYAAFLQENIWNKAGMQHTGVAQFGQPQPGQTHLYARSKKGKIKAAQENNLSSRIPGGGLYTCVGDLLRFGQAILNDALLAPATRALLFTDPGVDTKQNPYGMGWFLYGDNPNYGPVYGHSGEQTGAAAQLMLLPEQHAVIVVMANTSQTWRDVFQLSVQLFPLAAGAE